MLVLGIHGGGQRDEEDHAAGFTSHDAAAVLLRDGEIVAAIEEERLSRLKHSNSFPVEAIGFCLSQAGVGLSDVDWIALNLSEQTLDLQYALEALSRPGGQITSAREAIGSLFEKAFAIDVSAKLRFCQHHVAHAASAYYASRFDRALVVILDGDGEGLSGMVLAAENGALRPLMEYPEQKSLGNWYTSLINVLGYTRFDEYKVMGLAPLGNPQTYARMFKSFYRLLPGGDYEIEPITKHFYHLQREGLIEGMRRKGDPFTQRHKDFAAALQAALEDIGLHIVRHFQRQTGMDRLCLAGGVTHNCSLNGKILYTKLFRKIFAQPAAHDAGTALGAAWMVFTEEGRQPGREAMQHVYLGTHVGDTDEIGRALEAWSDFLEIEKVEDVEARTARLLADGAVVGWVQGQSEFGPRALGNRSILADPRPASNKDLINRMVKKREGYRPFAPSVCEESVGEYFETLPEQTDYPFMIFVLNVRPERRAGLGAITHADGTARVHTVSRDVNPRYWRLLREFAGLTGLPILLNTSFNNNAEPIVDSAEDAIACYLTTGLHWLVIGNYMARKRDLSPTDAVHSRLAPGLRRNRKLVRRAALNGDSSAARFGIECTANDFFCESRVSVAEDLFHLLMAADGRRSVASLAVELGITGDRRETLTRELVDLWGRRVIVLRPAQG